MKNEEIYSITQREEFKNLINFSICGITYPDKTYEIVRNNSSTACIEYVEEGIGKIKIGNTDFFAIEGDSYYLQQGYHQHYYSDSEQPWKKYFINLSGQLVASLTEGYGLKNIFHFKGLNLKKELKKIIELAKESNVDNTEELICIINIIFLKMRGHILRENSVQSTASIIKDFLNTKILETFRIDELCKYINKSESRAIQIFKKAYGITPYAYLLNEKINLAKKLLKNTNLPIRNIAFKLKFSDEYYFSNIFKEKTGIRPSAFRKL